MLRFPQLIEPRCWGKPRRPSRSKDSPLPREGMSTKRRAPLVVGVRDQEIFPEHFSEQFGLNPHRFYDVCNWLSQFVPSRPIFVG